MQILTMAFEFHWERFTQPAVIIGICIMIVGLILNFCAKPITQAIANKRKESGKADNSDLNYLAFKYTALGIMLIGMLVAILKMQY